MSMIEKEETVFPLFVVDAFTKEPFGGNGAAVCLIPFHKVVSKDVKQRIAAEMNRSETAYITTKSAGDSFEKSSRFGLEWFTPVCEVSLCGHATLAASAVLFFGLNNPSKELEFETLSGTLKAKRVADSKIQIDLPAYESHPMKGTYDDLVKVVVGSLPVQDVVLSDSKKLLIRLSDGTTREELQSIRTKDDELLSAASDVIGVIVTLNAAGKENCKDKSGKQYDFISRYFVPWLGVSEDPVTGSAHSVLGPYWAKIHQKNSLYARQCSERGGELDVEIVKERALLSGNAVIVIRGQIRF